MKTQNSKDIFREEHKYLTDIVGMEAVNYKVEKMNDDVYITSQKSKQIDRIKVLCYFFDQYGILHVGNREHHLVLYPVYRQYQDGHLDKIQSWDYIRNIVCSLPLATKENYEH